MGKRFVLAVSVIIGFSLALASFVSAASEEFYRGKVIRIIVGFSAGGGFDTYARAVSRYLGKYIPGNPTIVVENMTGAGSLIAANHVYKVAKPDGLTVGAFNGRALSSMRGRWAGSERRVTTTIFAC
jgi:tripartite-type tricarboxylate transporter receptor subunit TctC